MIARRPCGVREVREQFLEAGVVAEDGFAAAVHPDDVRRALEGAPHEGDPAVLPEMGDRLRVAAGEVQVGDGEFVEDGERAREALGGEVDRAVPGQGCGRGEEEGLRLDERTQPAVYALISLSHV
jgi:hypothetical protein